MTTAEAVDYRGDRYTSVKESTGMSMHKDNSTCDRYYWYAEGKYYFFFGLPDNENCIPAWKI